MIDELLDRYNMNMVLVFSLLMLGLAHVVCGHVLRMSMKEGEQRSLQCVQGQQINIRSAVYGKPPSCISSSSDRIIKSLCDGKPTCTLYASNVIHGDPCPGVVKSLIVTYQCYALANNKISRCSYSGNFKRHCGSELKRIFGESSEKCRQVCNDMAECHLATWHPPKQIWKNEERSVCFLFKRTAKVCKWSGAENIEYHPGAQMIRCKENAAHKYGHNWDYATNGPSTWGGLCKGKQQSPINIVTCETEKSSPTNYVIRHNYWVKFPGQYTMHNNGHALQVDMPTDTKYRLIKGNKMYTPLQMHIHFDPITNHGSEHTLNSKKYFAEIHIVHKKSSYSSKEILTHSDGILVIGMFVDLVKMEMGAASDLDFHLGGQDMIPNNGTSFAMQMFASTAKSCPNPDDSKNIDAFPLAWMLPKSPRKKSTFDYVNYHGSLTTPPCSEVVDWVVITGKLLQVNQKTANIFKSVVNSVKKPMAGNNRPIQELNGRNVYAVDGSI